MSHLTCFRDPIVRGGSSPTFRRRTMRAIALALALMLGATVPSAARAQLGAGSPVVGPHAAADAELDSLVLVALTRSPTIRAATARVAAARHRAVAASAPPDPMLMAGIQNQPLGRERSGMGAAATVATGPDPMTMRMIGVTQSIPYPGKLALRRRIAVGEAQSAEFSIETARRLVARDVKQAYYELAFIDQAREIVDRNRDILASVVRITDARYGLGTTSQTAVLESRLDGARLAESASGLAEQRNVAIARLDALLDRSAIDSALRPAIPARIARLALPATPAEIRFTSNVLGSRTTGSPLLPLAELQERAIANSPELREHEAMLGAQAARVELARRERLPDVDVSVQYGQRGGGLPDMVSASVSIPLPIFARRKQDQLTGDASAQLEALHAEHQASANALRADVAALVSDIERERTRLALYARALLPQGRALLTSATSSFQVGKAELRDVLEKQASLFTYETDNARVMADFAKQLAELERVVGTEVVR
ncbi:MAG: Outer rane efflux protein precursor [Gemmatimonadetes bacterium]|nr:Outer rane efflux protein precursor [Gemmatimonadota bacterium]